MVGGALASSLAYALEIPAIPVHHLEGHLLACMLEEPAPEFPFLALMVSGGHSQLIEVAGACVQECPVSIDHLDIINEMRRNLVLTESRRVLRQGGILRVAAYDLEAALQRVAARADEAPRAQPAKGRLVHGHALGVLPAETARHYAKLGLLVELPVSLKGILGPVALVTRRNHARPPAAETLLVALRRVAAELQK